MIQRAAVRAALLTDLPVVVETVTSTIRAEIPTYAALSTAQLREVSAIASWGIERILDLWVDGRDLTSTDITRFRGIGAARALDGRPLPGVLRAYRLAGRAITELVTTSAGDDLTVTDAIALANLWMSTIDSLSEALYEGHRDAEQRMTDDRERALADLLADLLAGRQVTVTALADRGRQLGIALPSRPCVLVIRTDDGTSLARGPLDEVLAGAGLASDEGTLRDLRGRRGVVVAAPSDIARLSPSLTERGLRGCAVEATGAGDLPRAYRLAELALDLAPDHACGGQRPHLDEGDAQVLALLAADPLADPARAVACVLGETTTPANAHLLEGLDAYLAHGSASAAASHLGLHAQTMRYRLRRLHELTGRDLRLPWDRFVTEAARRAGSR